MENDLKNLNQAPPPTAPPPAFPQSNLAASVITEIPKRGSGFKIFVTAGLVVIAGIYSGVAFLYLQNQKMKNGASQEEAQISTPEPTPVFAPDQIKIQNGSIVWEKPGTDAEILIDKNDFDSTGITGFAKVAVSPDNEKLCFESLPPAPEPALYWVKRDGVGVTEVSPNRKNCFWNADSKKIFYINSAPTGSAVNIYMFDLEDGSETDLTSLSTPEGVVRMFDIVGLSGDTQKLICTYEDAESTTAKESGQCEIIIEKAELNYLPVEG